MNICIITKNDNILLPFYEPEILQNHTIIHLNQEDRIHTIEKNIDLLFWDENISDSSIKQIGKYLKAFHQIHQFILISTSNNIYNYKLAIENKFQDFLLFDENFEKSVVSTIQKAQVENFDNLEDPDYSYLIKGESKAIEKVFEVMKKASGTNINVNITGETGTGKELIAQGIHDQSLRKQFPFVAVNVGAIPKDLIESELFGHEVGAFTGATKKRIGKFEEAEKGTLFLDEIGELPLELQTKLLRVLQEREITRIGGNDVIPVDVRLITATHRNLRNEVAENKFREDLYYRLLGLPLQLPPLRERMEDIHVLSSHFLQEASLEFGQTQAKYLSKGAFNKINAYSFPGNVRQLKAIIDLAVVLSDDNEIKSKDIHLEKEETSTDLLKKERTMEEYNIEIIEFFLKKYKGKVNYVADKLDISKSKIYQLIKDGKITK
ncbi:sigma-54 dependent transcriptional regulator [Flammeovirga sp. SubArs3]|uniref:sigma-54 interaction domain-containing protein n=1 Tax=Flammeovirga sp. SubArs3 TaxID=2995316 RepID=UPI00248D1FCD|nr:sigma-54 dependent transcriptional regulator [Flammeovirga sp. SubArs3]